MDWRFLPPPKAWCICAALFLTLFISLKLGTALGIESSPAETIKVRDQDVSLTQVNSFVASWMCRQAGKQSRRAVQDILLRLTHLVRCTSCDTLERWSPRIAAKGLLGSCTLGSFEFSENKLTTLLTQRHRLIWLVLNRGVDESFNQNLLDAGDPQIGLSYLIQPLIHKAGDLEGYGPQVIDSVDEGLDSVLLNVTHHPVYICGA